MAIYMKFGSVNGSVTTEGFKNWIELNSLQYGTNRQVTSGAGGHVREGSNPSISEIVVSKHLDASSTPFFADAVAGSFDTKVEIKMTTTVKNKVETYLTFELANCGLSSYSASSGGDMPMESLSLNFTKITITPTPLDHAGQIKKGNVVSYDLEKMKAS
mgnify:FL=1